MDTYQLHSTYRFNKTFLSWSFCSRILAIISLALCRVNCKICHKGTWVWIKLKAIHSESDLCVFDPRWIQRRGQEQRGGGERMSERGGRKRERGGREREREERERGTGEKEGEGRERERRSEWVSEREREKQKKWVSERERGGERVREGKWQTDRESERESDRQTDRGCTESDYLYVTDITKKLFNKPIQFNLTNMINTQNLSNKH